MSTIVRTLTISPVEPALLSMRAPDGLETWVDFRYLAQDGLPFPADIAGQLHLTGRSSKRTTSYLVPATDRVNGRARAVLPAGDLSDPNGYRLRLTGTVNSQLMLVAVGTVMPILMDGLVEPYIDEIDTVDLSFQRDEDVLLNVKVWTDDAKANPYDLTASGTVLSANIYNFKNGSVLMPFAVTVLAANEVQLSLPKGQVNILPDDC